MHFSTASSERSASATLSENSLTEQCLSLLDRYCSILGYTYFLLSMLYTPRMYREDIRVAINALEHKYLSDAAIEIRQGHFSQKEGIKHIRKEFGKFKKSVEAIFMASNIPLASYERDLLEQELKEKYSRFNRIVRAEGQLLLAVMDDTEPLPPITFDFKAMDIIDRDGNITPQIIS